MPRLPQVSGAEAIRALERLEFVRVRQRGSHVILKKRAPAGDVGCVVIAPGTGARDTARHSQTGQSGCRRLQETPVARTCVFTRLPSAASNSTM
ncbi:MAG: type II toxin-antitoxin system HicA family toxin [Terriglobales bacterium]